ncbi:glycosyltransferase family 2 protein [Legionella israelensis]|uniref:glycosyltransferase family 2 protein n=1 Tax=Legionella israelensis TaxID=454 RepID=UPI0011817012|nr:glycosyltransferase family 2 protein [Legionella israelensis]QDP72381.1 glycosyltransferase family 2 protein [Legionella israelensis]
MKIVYSIVIPVFNSESTLREIYQRIVKVMTFLGTTFEIIFVEDCGTDNSWVVLTQIAQRDKRVKAIQLLSNVGQGSATLAGISQSKGEYIITLDDDLQNPPEELPKLINSLIENKNMDVVMGVPKNVQHSFFRRWSSNMINRMNSFFLNKKPELRTTSFRIMRRQVADALLRINTPYPSLGPMLLSVTRRIDNIVVDHHQRKEGKSGYNLMSLTRQSLSNIVGYSVMPLHMLAVVGVAGILFCFLFSAYYLFRYFTIGIDVPGWMTLLLMLTMFSSFNFLAFSLLGEYVLRIMRVSTSPAQWAFRNIISQEKSPVFQNSYIKENEKKNEMV